MIESRHLKYFTVLADTLHYGRAAELLHMSQPPLSRQIAALETELGVKLLERDQRNVQLTPAGESFLRNARDILERMERAKRDALAAGRGEQGTLCIGFMVSSTYSVVPALTRAYASAFPRVGLRLLEMTPTVLFDAIRTGKIDIGISYSPDDVRQLESRTVFREPLVAVLPREHRLASQDTIDVADLADETFLISPHGASPHIYNTIIDHCRKAGFLPNIGLETNLQQTIVNMVGEGLGVAIVNRSMRNMRLANVVFRSLRQAPVVETSVVWKAGNPNPCTQGFIHTAQGVGRDLSRVHVVEDG